MLIWSTRNTFSLLVDMRMTQPLWICLTVSYRAKQASIIQPEISLLSIYSGELNLCPHKNLYPNVCSFFIYYSPKVKITKISFSGWKSKKRNKKTNKTIVHRLPIQWNFLLKVEARPKTYIFHIPFIRHPGKGKTIGMENISVVAKD